MSGPRTQVGVVGAGVIARRHVRTLATFADVEVAGIADVDLERAAALAQTVSARPYDCAAAMLDSQSFDAVYLCLPPFAHGDIEFELIERQLPFFVEKPLAADLQTAERVAEAVSAAGLLTGAGYHWRWLDTVERARDLLAGRPARLINGFWLDATPPLSWWQRQETSGGQLVEQATHLVDTARLLVGEVDEVFGYTGRTDRADYPDLDVADVSLAALRFVTGAVGSITATCLLTWPHRVAVHLYAEGLTLELTEKQLVVTSASGSELYAASGDPFLREDRAFLDAVQGRDDRTRASYAEALRTHRITTTALRSAQLRRPLPIPDSPA